MPDLVVYAVAVALTALSVFLGDRSLFRRLRWFEAAAVGFAVVTLGVVTTMLGGSATAVVAVPLVAAALLMLVLLQSTLPKLVLTYLAVGAYYVALHVVASRFFDYDTLVPGWPLG
ncbi:hypothetical protein [Georgenia muralis]|uniref:Uncharacterized protein n=1 Tax=Georgenia muralis TaxID=154117 RepID=A0A3N5A2L7_9MICO|nr:hypothetical protein [Georgenia muralis]RPF26101.1 hypothetical protein EDD32_0526 [Georgenia muralis]